MWKKKFAEIAAVFKSTPVDRYYFKNISHSVITIVSRAPFEVTEEWFSRLLAISYDTEVQAKYVPELHETNDFERKELRDILDFPTSVGYITQQLHVCEDYISRFKRNYQDFYQVIEAEGIEITHPDYLPMKRIKNLHHEIEIIEKQLAHHKQLLQAKGYEILSLKAQFYLIHNPIEGTISIERDMWMNFLASQPADVSPVYSVFQGHNQVYYELSTLERMLSHLKNNSSGKIIGGNAGTGKTHILAHLVKEMTRKGEYVLFFKPKQFNGDDVELERRLLQLMEVPRGYTLPEVLDKINVFAKTSDKRCFIIVDALNETTKSSIGFSTIWRNYLQEFVNKLSFYPNLYFVCSLRISYIDHIWATTPENLVELKGFDRRKDLRELCETYFDYYKITVNNLETADLSLFQIPLLLDLYCRLINENRQENKTVVLDVNTYVRVFEDYIAKVVKEVKTKLDLQQAAPIKDGFNESAETFYQNNEAEVEVDDFSQAFDADNRVTADKSIARLVLEGYLIFIKDISGRKTEIVKHTQQEVGGYLLAKMLIAKFPEVDRLLADAEFQEKVIGNNPDMQHQLRIDILKFLVALKPEIILRLQHREGLVLGWWYLYNGYRLQEGDAIPGYLLDTIPEKVSISTALDISSYHWLEPGYPFNFTYVTKALQKLSVWEFDAEWSFYIYKEADFFHSVIASHTAEIANTSLESDKVTAKLAAFTAATTIRELRDEATIYLVEFGKKHPLELLKLTESCAKIQDSYIYERLVSSCYGVSIILQNDEEFVKTVLPVFAQRLYNIQFAENATAPSSNYIVIDSVKHLVDLAVYKDVYQLEDAIRDSFTKYQFPKKVEWNEASEQQLKLIEESHEMSWPEPIGMDFGIYTIPRLIDRRGDERHVIANVYSRIYELGYKHIVHREFNDAEFSNFYNGREGDFIEGKVDRLGKKYSWKGFFDFAGVLLQRGELKVFNDNNGHVVYDRLTDVDIDISLPNKDYKLDIRLYEQKLIPNRSENPEWYKQNKQETLVPLFTQTLNGHKYTMLHGFVEDRINKEYKTRSFLLTETFFIRRNEEIEVAKQVNGVVFPNWDNDNHYSPDYLRHSYFGELYWADTIGNPEENSISVPTGKSVMVRRAIKLLDVLQDRQHSRGDIGKEIEELREERVWFESEPTLAEFSWESDSKTVSGYTELYPSLKMGKELDLRADPASGKILDDDLQECHLTLLHKDDLFKNEFSYMRSDLLKKYMEANNLALLYQVKQHSYEESAQHNRSLAYWVFD